MQFATLLLLVAAGASAERPAGSITYDAPRQLAELANRRIDESSGIACSHRAPGCFWTHNDSGDDARLYLFDSQGRDLGSCTLAGITAFDWEDLASFVWQGKNYLLVAETGNNSRNAGVEILYLVEEPACDARRGVMVREVPVVETIHLAYDDRYRDCEAVAIDPTDRTILLASKEAALASHFYQLRWPEPNAEKAFIAAKIASPPLPMVTAMDISPDGRRAVVLTYLNAFEYVRGEGESWKDALARPPQPIVVPWRKQGESICYGSDGKTLYLTSEKRPTPLWEVPVAKTP